MSFIRTSNSNSLRTISETVRAILMDEKNATFCSGLLKEAESDLNPASMDYKHLEKQAEIASNLADKTNKKEYMIKAANLHLDAASEAHTSAGKKLYSKTEIYHLAKAKYYQLRSQGMDQGECLKRVHSFESELNSHDRFIVPQPAGDHRHVD